MRKKGGTDALMGQIFGSLDILRIAMTDGSDEEGNMDRTAVRSWCTCDCFSKMKGMEYSSTWLLADRWLEDGVSDHMITCLPSRIEVGIALQCVNHFVRMVYMVFIL